MAKLRHIAIQVPDLQKAAKFYEDVFDLKRVAEVEAPIGNAISLSDGTVNLTLLHFPEGERHDLILDAVENARRDADGGQFASQVPIASFLDAA